MRSKPNLISLCGIADDATEVDLSGLGMDADDAIILASELPDKRALTSLDISNNGIGHHYYRGGPGQYNYLHTGDHHLHRNDEPPEGLGSIGVIAVADAIKNNGGISSVNLLKNTISVEQAQELVKIMRSKEKLTTLCGLSGNETTLDFSNQGLGPGDAVLIANDISDMRALSTVTMYNFPLPIQDIKTSIELDFSGKKLRSLDAIVIAALLPLNVSGTQFGYPIIADITFC
jgi:hypothetical protein